MIPFDKDPTEELTAEKDGSPKRGVRKLLLEPAASVKNHHDRRSAEMLSLITLIAGAAALATALYGSGLDPLSSGLLSVNGLFFGIALIAGITYIFSRTRHFMIGSLLFAAALAGVAFAFDAVTDMTGGHLALLNAGLAALSLMTSAILLGPKATLVVILLNLALPVSHNVVPGAGASREMGSSLALTAALSTLAFLATMRRERLKRDYTSEIADDLRSFESIKTSVEKLLDDQTRKLNKRLAQLQMAAEAGRSLSTAIDPQDLFEPLVNMISDRFQLYFAGLFLLVDNGRTLQLEAGSAESGRALVEYGLTLEVGGPTAAGQAAQNRNPRIAQDTAQEGLSYDNPFLQLTRAEIALPIIYGGQLYGVLSAQSTKANALDEDDLAALEIIATALAAAVALKQSEAPGLARPQVDLTRKELVTSAEGEFESIHARVVPESAPPPANEPPNDDQIRLPLTLHDRVIGFITLDSAAETSSPETRAWLDHLISQGELELDQLTNSALTNTISAEGQLYADLTAKLWGSADMDTILKTAVRAIGQALNASEALIKLDLNPELAVHTETEPD